MTSGSGGQEVLESIVAALPQMADYVGSIDNVSFSGDHFGRPEMLNVINVDLSGFSRELAALEIACAAPR